MRHKGNRDSIDFANEPVGQLFRQMLVPTLIGMVSLVILNLTDGAFIGHGAGADSLAAINIASPVFNILSGIGIMFGIGGSVVASIHLSRGEVKEASINVTQSLAGGVFFAVLASILILCNLPETCRLFGSSDVLLPLASSYLKWIAIGAPLMLIHMTGEFLIRLDGSPKYAMATSIVGTSLNIFLDWLFIFPMGWGLEGAAKATCFSFGISGLMSLYYFIFKAQTIRLCSPGWNLKALFRTIKNLGYQARMGFSAMLGEIAVSGAVIAGNFVFAKYLGESGVAAYSVACYCFPVVFMMANAIVQSAQPIVSFAYGADNQSRLLDSGKLMLRWALGAGVTGSLLLCFGAPFIISLFLDRAEPAFRICTEGLPYFGTGILFITLNIVIIGYLQSVERSVMATVLTLLRGFIFVIPCFIFMPLLMGTTGIWLAIPVAEFITTVITVCILMFSFRHEVQPVQSRPADKR